MEVPEHFARWRRGEGGRVAPFIALVAVRHGAFAHPAAAGVATFGFAGRGVWIGQPQAASASQPRCAATVTRPSSPAIQLAARLGLVHVHAPRGWEALKKLNWSIQEPRPKNPKSATPEAEAAIKKRRHAVR